MTAAPLGRDVLVFAPTETVPDRRAVLRAQGIPAGASLPARIEGLLEEAFELYTELAHPRAVWQPISSTGFGDVYRGEGLNAASTPVSGIYPQAGRLALFALTLGQRLSADIGDRFKSNDLALAAMLDSVASEAAEKVVELLGRRFLDELADEEIAPPDTTVLSYSPGYCGWHITGQLSLFSVLHPEEIGITLSSSSLMTPLKSVSGVLVAGRGTIHLFKDDFDFCERCTTRGCRGRMALVRPTEDRNGDSRPDQHDPAER